MIQLHNVFLAYQKDATALNGINLRIEKGEFVFLTGPSGAGKTTLLRLLYGALTPTRGQVLIDGQNVSRMTPSQIPFLRRSVGVVFQDFKLLPNRTVFENVSITLEVLGWGRADIGKKVMHVLKQMGMESKIAMTPQRLSGGEQQRVALARALVNDPKILVADEPTGNLDDANKNQILNIFKEANVRGTTVVVATHDRRLIDNCHKRLVTLSKGEIVEQVEKESTPGESA
ncbi:cell division ATP-binding protein FtsE [Oryzomonas japonica]|uniref:Cell division ATP-binding protein FtsE n=3 Tax=Oryzomonas TaxID=2855184 RepID=A0A5A9XMP5_9BACT|nr:MULTISPECIES: cell division ATP-binding protein FtsE [Oryzomonas]KAA0893933.1 cell division ATP-binding protein FtsE [Oryzomonas rubra]KAB0665849.1 cell division ATP-binding protein FtsE [Oryzomonas japonica]KAB0669324.1 cell division ATP-binding protein FtsE [Oryzomonas sagensis]